jgi:hypothetical protein
MNKKWITVIILVVLGVVLGIVAIEWVTVPIHKLPALLNGKHHVKGKYKRRGEALGVVAVVLLGIAGYLAYTIKRGPAATAPAADAPAAASSGDLLGSGGDTPAADAPATDDAD